METGIKGSVPNADMESVFTVLIQDVIRQYIRIWDTTLVGWVEARNPTHP